MKILVIDDKAEERENAKAAVEAAGHEAVVFEGITDGYFAPKFWKMMEEVDGVITDLFFNPYYNSNGEVNDAYKINPPPTGLVVAANAISLGKPVAICTSGNHHGSELSFIYDAYVGMMWTGAWSVNKEVYDRNAAFAWEEDKDWAMAVKLIETRLAR